MEGDGRRILLALMWGELFSFALLWCNLGVAAGG
jgi:hypothetical protein